MYTSPAVMDGLTVTCYLGPQAAGTTAGTGYGVNYTGVEGLTVNMLY